MDEALEARIRGHAGAGRMREAATAALEGYGPELLGWLVAALGDAGDAEDVFSMLSEDLWRGLPGFRWECSMRTWLYTLARHARARLERSPHRRAARRADRSTLADVEEAVRSRTRPWLRTEVKDRFTALRDELPEDDRSLLVLRVDRRMAWDDIARVMGGDEAVDDTGRRRVAARLRKRFSALKERLRRRAAEEGLVVEP